EGGPGDVNRPEERGLYLTAEVLGCHLLEEAGVEAASVVDEDVEPSKLVDGRLHGCRGCGRLSNVERHREQCFVLTECLRDCFDAASGGDHLVSGVERCFGNVDAETASGSGDGPNLG